jgi:Ca2+-binding EF-hand superfamily protein
MEMRKAIVRAGIRLLWLFNHFDKDCKGFLTFEEFKYMIQKISAKITTQ